MNKQAVKAIKNVIEKGDIIQETPNYENNGVDWIILAAKETINNVPAYVGVIVRRFYNSKTSRNTFYLHEALIKKTDSHIMTGPQLSGDTGSESVLDNTVSQEDTTVNNKSMQENGNNAKVNFSERGQSVYKLLGENQRLQKENERLKEKVKFLNDFVKLQRKDRGRFLAFGQIQQLKLNITHQSRWDIHPLANFIINIDYF